jgi:hypothetical protein
MERAELRLVSMCEKRDRMLQEQFSTTSTPSPSSSPSSTSRRTHPTGPAGGGEERGGVGESGTKERSKQSETEHRDGEKESVTLILHSSLTRRKGN